MEQLRAGDTLELMTPTGSFGTPLHPLARKNYVAIVAGSGITPALSILQTTLAVETDSRFTLVYGDRDADSTLFREELDDLESRYADRLRIIHVRSRDPRHPAHLRGRVDRPKLERWLGSDLAPASVDDWFLCGPVEMVTDLRGLLIERGTEPDRVHVELFHGYQKPIRTNREHGTLKTCSLFERRKCSVFERQRQSRSTPSCEAHPPLRQQCPTSCSGGGHCHVHPVYRPRGHPSRRFTMRFGWRSVPGTERRWHRVEIRTVPCLLPENHSTSRLSRSRPSKKNWRRSAAMSGVRAGQRTNLQSAANTRTTQFALAREPRGRGFKSRPRQM